MNKIWKIKIETAGTFFLEKKPTGKTLCEKIKGKVPEDFRIKLIDALQGWPYSKPLMHGTTVYLPDHGSVTITCLQQEVL